MATQGCFRDLDEETGGRREDLAIDVAQFGGAAMFVAAGARGVCFGPAFED